MPDQNHTIRRIDAGGTTTTLLGTGAPGFTPDGPVSNLAPVAINQPRSVQVTASGDVVFIERGNARVRRFAGGEITTVAGGGEAAGLDADGELATSALLDSPQDLFLDEARGSLFLTDARFVWRVDLFTGRLHRVAGTGTPGFSGDGGPAAQAQIDTPLGVTGTTSGDILLFFSDLGNFRVRKVGADGLIHTIHTGALAGIRVNPAAATRFDVIAFSTLVVAGEPFGPFEVRVVDEFDNLVTDFSGQAEVLIGGRQVALLDVEAGLFSIPVDPSGVEFAGTFEVEVRDTASRFAPTRTPTATALPRRNPLGCMWAAIGQVMVKPAFDATAFAPFPGVVGDHVLHVIAQSPSLFTPVDEVDELGNPLSLEGGAALPGAEVQFQLVGDGVAMPAALGFVSQEIPTHALWNGGVHDGRDVITGADVVAIPFRAFREVAGGSEPEEVVVTFEGRWRAHIYRLMGITVERLPPVGNPRAFDDSTSPIAVTWPLADTLLTCAGEKMALRAHSNEQGPPFGLLVPGTVAAETKWAVRTPSGGLVCDLGAGATELDTTGLQPGEYVLLANLCDDDEPFVINLLVVDPFLRVSIDGRPLNPEAGEPIEIEVCDMKTARGHLVWEGSDMTRFTLDDVICRAVDMEVRFLGDADRFLAVAPKMEGRSVGLAAVRHTPEGAPARLDFALVAPTNPAPDPVTHNVTIRPLPGGATFRVTADDGFDRGDSTKPAPDSYLVTTSVPGGEEIVISACFPTPELVPADFEWEVRTRSVPTPLAIPSFDRWKHVTSFPRGQSGTYVFVAKSATFDQDPRVEETLRTVEVRIYEIEMFDTFSEPKAGLDSFYCVGSTPHTSKVKISGGPPDAPCRALWQHGHMNWVSIPGVDFGPLPGDPTRLDFHFGGGGDVTLAFQPVSVGNEQLRVFDGGKDTSSKNPNDLVDLEV